MGKVDLQVCSYVLLFKETTAMVNQTKLALQIPSLYSGNIHPKKFACEKFMFGTIYFKCIHVILRQYR